MSVAFSDAVIIRDELRRVKNFADTDSVVKALDEFYVKRKPLAATVNILAGALYAVFTPGGEYIYQYTCPCC